METRHRSINDLVVSITQNQRLNYKEFTTKGRRIIYPVWNPLLKEDSVHPIDALFIKPVFYVEKRDRILPGYPWLTQSRSYLPGFYTELKVIYTAIIEKYQLNKKTLSRDLIPTLQANKDALENHLIRYEAWIEDLSEELKLILLAWLHLAAPVSKEDQLTRKAWMNEEELINYRFRIEDVLLNYDSEIVVDSLSPEDLLDNPEWFSVLKQDSPLRHLYFQIRCLWKEAIFGAEKKYLKNWFVGLVRAYPPAIEIENSVIESSVVEAFVYYAGIVRQFRKESLELDKARAIHDVVLHRVIMKKDVTQWKSILNSFMTFGGGPPVKYRIEQTEQFVAKFKKENDYPHHGVIEELITFIQDEYERKIGKSPSRRTVASHLSKLGVKRNFKN